MQCFWNPYPISAIRIPIVAGRSKVAEPDLPPLFVDRIFQIRSSDYRHFHRYPSERRTCSLLQYGWNNSFIVTTNHCAFIHIPIRKTTVAGKYKRTMHHRLMMVALYYFRFQFEIGNNFIAGVPFTSYLQITTFMQAFLRLAISIAAAFTFTHLEFSGRKPMLIVLLVTMFIPPDALLYPNYSTVAGMGLLDTYWGIILPSVFSASSLLMILGAFRSCDKNIYEAARIDGSGDGRYVLQILLPMTRSIIAAVFLQTFITAFNSYLWPLLVTSRMSMRTVQVGITMLGFAESGEFGAQFAAIMMITLPFLIILVIARRKMMQALSDSIIN